MSLPPHEQIRNRRERNFQTRVLAAVEKPKQWRIIKIINAPFFLWIISAMFLTFGSTFLTAYRQCMTDAERLSERYEKLLTEIERRQLAIIEIVRSGETIPDIQKNLKGITGTYVEFATTPLLDLMDQRDRLIRRVDFLPVEEPIKEREKKLSDLIEEFERAGVKTLRYRGALEHGSVVGLKEDDLPWLKLYANTMLLYYQGTTDRTFKITIPRCYVSDTILGLASGGSGKILIVDDRFYDMFYPDKPVHLPEN